VTFDYHLHLDKDSNITDKTCQRIKNVFSEKIEIITRYNNWEIEVISPKWNLTTIEGANTISFMFHIPKI